MDRQAILQRLKQNEANLRAKGIVRAALFGSRARGDHRPDSDTDVMIELDPALRLTIFDYVGIKDYVGDLLEGKVEVINRKDLPPEAKNTA